MVIEQVIGYGGGPAKKQGCDFLNSIGGIPE
jgi:hypothetical protein